MTDLNRPVLTPVLREISIQVSFMRVVRAIARVTFLEIVREKVLYNVLVAAILIFGIGLLAASCTYGSPERVVLDFGYAALSISSLLLATLMGGGLLGKEFERRTAWVALSHPISPFHFVLGKFLGLVQILAVNGLLLIAIYLLLLVGQSESFGWKSLSFTFVSALWLALVQSWVMAAIAIFFSSFSTTSLSVIFSLGVYLMGINSSQFRFLAAQVDSGASKVIFNGISAVLPNFEHFNLGLKLTYDLPIAGRFVGMSTLYGLLIILFCLILSGILVERKER